MSMKTIMLVCAAGMSTSMLVSKMEKAAEADGVETDIFAVSANEADSYLASKPVDVLLLGPQVKFLKKQMESKVADKSIPVEVIDMRDYGMMNGKSVLDRALALSE